MNFITATSPVGPIAVRDQSAAQELSPVGFHRVDRCVYLLETFSDTDAELEEDLVPELYAIHTRGMSAGRRYRITSFPGIRDRDAAGADDVREALFAHLRRLAAGMRPLRAQSTDAFRTTTWVMRKRALILSPSLPPVRKFSLRIGVGSALSAGACEQLYATAYIRPHARLKAAFAVPGEDCALALVTYPGSANPIGGSVDGALITPLPTP